MPFKKGEGGRPKGSKNKTNAALSQAIASAAPQTPLAVMLEAMTYYHRQWKRLEDGPDRRFAAELTMPAARLAAPYCHARGVIVRDGRKQIGSVRPASFSSMASLNERGFSATPNQSGSP